MKQKELIINGAHVALSEEQIKKIDNFFATLAKELGIKIDESAEETAVPDCLDFYILSLAKRLNWKPDKVLGFLNKLAEIRPILPFNLLLKEIAVELDKQYDGHIKNSKEIWVVSVLNGSICMVNKDEITTYDNFAAFRTKEDAKFALKVLAEQYNDIFGGK